MTHNYSIINAVASRSRRLTTHPDATLGPDTLAARVLRHPTMMLGGPRALLLQILETGVAAGVAQHSQYGVDPYQRLASTLATIRAIAFGSPEQAELMRARMGRAHDAVNGVSSSGATYSAHDEQLSAWVYAALMGTVLTVEERYVRQLARDEREVLFGELTVLGQAMGVRGGLLPDTLGGFEEWMALRTSQLCEAGLSTEAVAVAEGVLRPSTSALRLILGVGRTPAAIGVSSWIIANVTADLGPAVLCRAFGLPEVLGGGTVRRRVVGLWVRMIAASRYALYFPTGTTTPMIWLTERLAT